VVEALADVVDWHRRALVPLGAELTADPRCAFVNGDFFALVDSPAIDSTTPGKRFDAILIDIDHSPAKVLHPAHAAFYRRAGLRRMSEHLRPGGVFGLWSDDPPDAAFPAELDAVFARSQAHVVRFAYPLQDRKAACTVYIAHGFAIA
jgi:spermidine synthase